MKLAGISFKYPSLQIYSMAAKVGVFTRSHTPFYRRPRPSSKACTENTQGWGNSNTEVKPPHGLGCSPFGGETQIAAYVLRIPGEPDFTHPTVKKVNF